MKEYAPHFLIMLLLIEVMLTIISVDTRQMARALDRIAIAQEARR